MAIAVASVFDPATLVLALRDVGDNRVGDCAFCTSASGNLPAGIGAAAIGFDAAGGSVLVGQG